MEGEGGGSGGEDVSLLLNMYKRNGRIVECEMIYITCSLEYSVLSSTMATSAGLVLSICNSLNCDLELKGGG